MCKNKPYKSNFEAENRFPHAMMIILEFCSNKKLETLYTH